MNTETPPPADASTRVASFETGVNPWPAFGHREHLHLAWDYLEVLGLEAALSRLPVALRAFATAAGAPEKYHHTVTCAYLMAIHDRRARGGSGATFDEFLGRNPALLEPWRAFMRRYYRDETLEAPLAREAFLWPDGPGPAGAPANGFGGVEEGIA